MSFSRVFADDEAFKPLIEQWGREECQHGRALARWVRLADPAFDFDEALTRFRTRYSLPLDADVSVRDSRVGEMISRCVVESGTSSNYTALRNG